MDNRKQQRFKIDQLKKQHREEKQKYLIEIYCKMRQQCFEEYGFSLETARLAYYTKT